MLQEKLKRDEKSMSKEERAEAQNAINTFKNKFPISALNRGAILLFTKTKYTALKVEIDVLIPHILKPSDFLNRAKRS